MSRRRRPRAARRAEPAPRRGAGEARAGTRPSADHRRAALAALALVAATFAAYLPAMQGGFVWDDDDYVTENQALRSFEGLGRIWLEPGAVPQYYPLTFTTLWLQFQLSGIDPAPYHVANVLLHWLAAVLLALVLRRLGLPGAWLAAAVFALHPVHVESVAWITERKNVLSGAFGIGAVLAYLRAGGVGSLRPATGVGAGAARDIWRPRLGSAGYLLALGLFACALLSKTVTCTIPVVLALLVWWQRGRIARDEALPLLPFLLLGGALAMVTVWMEQTHVGARGADWDLSLLDRVLIAGRAVWFYAATLAWPRDLTFVYPRWQIDAASWWQYVFPLAALGLVAALVILRPRIGRGPLTAVLCFAVTLFPALGFIDVYPMRYTFVADHYQYLASVALIAPAIAVVWRAARGLAAGRRRLATAAATALLLVLGVLTWRQGHVYADLETLWRDTITKNPGAQMAHVNLGMYLSRTGRLDEAIRQLEEARRLDPTDPEVRDNLGITLAALGRNAEAKAELEAAIELAPHRAPSHNNLANLLVREGRMAEAVTHYEEAARLDPLYADAHGNLANVLARQGHIKEAVARYRQALTIDPGFAEAHFNLGVVLEGSGRPDEAIAHYREALRINPGYTAARHALAGLGGSPAGGAP